MSRELTVIPPQLPLDDEIQTLNRDADSFEQWWRTYPRRVGKKAARISYDRIVRNQIATAEELLTGALRYAAERSNENPRYTKHPAAWLDDERWTDEPPPAFRQISSVSEGVQSYLSGESVEDLLARVRAGR